MKAIKIKDKYCPNNKPTFIGSPIVTEQNGFYIPNYTTNPNQAGVMNSERFEEAKAILPILPEALEHVDIQPFINSWVKP